jgi:hypothetical protein
MLNPIDLKKSTRLTDEEIKATFSGVMNTPLGTESCFLNSFATAVLAATRRDFMILRPTALILIAKYHLAAQAAEGANNANQERRAG